MTSRSRLCRLSFDTSRSNSVSCMSEGIRKTVRASSTSETLRTTKRGHSLSALCSTRETR